MKKIILASGSPRRKELLQMLDVEFSVADKFSVEEIYPLSTPVAEVPLFLAHLKSNACPHKILPDEILLTADTVVVLNGEILGKPADKNTAIAMLTALSGVTHTVITGVVMRTETQTISFSDAADVTFADLSADEIQYYVNKYSPYDKAGAYGVQQWLGCAAITEICGSFYNVMGLPTAKVYAALKVLQ